MSARAARIAHLKASALRDVSARYGLRLPEEGADTTEFEALRTRNDVEAGFDAATRQDQAGSSNGNEPGLTRS